ncbi:MAG TPA: hypothetical protein DCM59_13465 [Clostridium sp.]|nr:hypothetical protein [Clostridium sp.]
MLKVHNEIFKEIMSFGVNSDHEGLRAYLLESDFEVVKVAQTIMYIGRDKYYLENSTPEQIYRYNREFFDKQGWNTQGIEVGQMVGKGPVFEYLKMGFKILEISI